MALFKQLGALRRVVAGARVGLAAARRVSTSAARREEMHDPLEHATGIERRELCAYVSGDCDPWHIMPIHRCPGTKDKPIIVPSAFPKRLVGCMCHEMCMSINYMWLFEGYPRRCECGFWYELCRVPGVMD